MIDDLKTHEIFCSCRQAYVLLLVCAMLPLLFLTVIVTNQTDQL